jgi:hypothetical protein
MGPSRNATFGVGLATLLMGAYGCVAIPSLFDACTEGEITLWAFMGATLAVATLLGGGVRFILAKRSRGKLFVASAILFLLCGFSDVPIMRILPLQAAILGSIVGAVFALRGWFRTRTDRTRPQ